MSITTMRKAYHSWHRLNARLESAWKELNLHYLALFDKAQTCQIDTSQGLLRLASSILRHPFDPQTLQLRQRPYSKLLPSSAKASAAVLPSHCNSIFIVIPNALIKYAYSLNA